MIIRFLRMLFIAILGLFLFQASKKEAPIESWSSRMAQSEIHRNPEPWMIDFRNKPKWEYTQGLVLKAMLQVYQSARDENFYRYVKAYYDQFIDSTGQIQLYKMSDYNIDRINPGKPLFYLYQVTGDAKYKKAIELLRKQMKTQPRTHEGGFWHKKRYPHQMWLDGLYMASPFLAEFAKTFDEPELFDDVANQLILMDKYARDEKTGLLYHGWDESRQQQWADPETGLSASYWGRGMGWYAMALVDVLDFLPVEHRHYPDIIAILNRLTEAIVKVQDPETGLWYQVLDQPNRKGNYLESSAATMFAYTLFKAVRYQYIDRCYLKNTEHAWQGILNRFIEVDDEGWIHIHQGCAGAGLGGNPYRDGSYDYYISEKVRSNDPKSVGPFILAALERELLQAQ